MPIENLMDSLAHALVIMMGQEIYDAAVEVLCHSCISVDKWVALYCSRENITGLCCSIRSSLSDIFDCFRMGRVSSI